MMNTLSSDDENTDDFAEKPKILTKMTANQKIGSKNMTAQGKTSSPSNNRNLKSIRSKVSVNTQKEENSDHSISPLKSSHEDVVQQNKHCKRADDNVEDFDEDLEDFCVRPRKITKKEDSSQMVAQQQSPNFKSLSQCSVAGGSEQPSCSSPNSKQASQQCEGPKTQGIIPRVPKIYYCSRSHAQLNQVIAELRKTEYKDVNMTVLSSREFTCIQKRGSARNKTELCNTLLDPIEGHGCMYYHNVSCISTHSALKRNTSLVTPWDIEDLVTAGRKLWACPYFTARELIASADIVFCPYIYLIDPKISSSMKLDIAGAIIILDEAHNIEECCREAASYSVSCYELEEAVKDCRRVATLDVLPELHNKLAEFLTNLLGWISEKIKCPYIVNNKYGKEKTENVFSGVETTVNLERHNITLQDISEFKNLAQEAMTETNKEENKIMMRMRGQRYGIVPTTKSVLLGISYVMGFMYDNNMQHLHDYFVVISKTPVLSGTSMRDLPEEFRDSEANELRPGNEFWSERSYFINFLCMNSAVIFKPISEKARTIVLASGTLSPLDTYESELGAVFPSPISTSHIIGKEQVFVAAVSQGPTGKILLANYEQTQNGPFKDELGSTILEICKCVPYGVLCFLPSYSLLKTLEMRWTETKLWSQLEEYKIVMCEPQNSREYPAVVEAFQNCVKCCEQGVGNGPLLFAVMRGKASEGMNFADNMARAVISVGIPYPHLRNILVILKRYYNTTYCRTQKLENGGVWYRTQAYRALNQALGRCIRHSKDWGALIMIDQRLTSSSGQINSLSKWIGENMQIFKYYAPFHSQLESFIKSHVEAGTEGK